MCSNILSLQYFRKSEKMSQKISNFPQIIDVSQPTFWISIGTIFLMPTLWNIIGQSEYRFRWITKLCGGTKNGVKLVGTIIFSLSMYRNILYKAAIDHQPVLDLDPNMSSLLKLVGAILMIVGLIFVVSSSHMLGFEGTYLGWYCILVFAYVFDFLLF